MPSGFAVEQAASAQVVAAWVVPPSTVAAAPTPGWRVLGEYYLPASCVARLDAVHCVNDAALTSRLRLWDVAAEAAVAGAVLTQSLAPVRTIGTPVQLTGGRVYQVQAECTGSNLAGKFSAILSATISD